MFKNIPGIVVLITGFVTMAFEIVGSRILGPYFGASVFVWTSLIGIIMGSLSLGYWAGGKMSVNKSDYWVLSLFLSMAALFILLPTIGNTYILDRVVKYVPGVRLRTVVSSIVLFSPASIGFGMVLPYAIKLSIQNVESSGGTIGNLYAASTFGSILGTFAAGFFLIPFFGFTNVMFILTATLIALSVLLLVNKPKILPGLLSAIVVILLLVFWIKDYNKEMDYIDVDTRYNRVLIFDTKDAVTGRPIKMLRVNDENSSAMFLDGDDDLAFEVLKYYRLMEHFVPGFKSALMIGGSGYAFPKDFLKRYPHAQMDVVEIDPGLTALAKKYFNLTDHPNLGIYHEDGRTFLNTNSKKYDAILMDAYKSMITIPYQLTTREAVQKIHDALSPEGAVLANVISSLDPATNQFLMAELATYKSVFKEVYLFAVQYPDPTPVEKTYFQNFMLVGLKSNTSEPFTSENAEINNYLKHYYPLEVSSGTVILTDEFAPVEYLASRALN